MASSSGTSSGGSSSLMAQNSGSEESLQALMDKRKRKRMISNRESARRSRMRKQKHLDDLMAQVAQLRKDNHQIITSINIATQHYMNIESENSVLRAQLGELTHRLHSLNEIISFLDASNNNNIDDDGNGGAAAAIFEATSMINEPAFDNFMNPLNLSYLNQPIMASADMFHQY